MKKKWTLKVSTEEAFSVLFPSSVFKSFPFGGIVLLGNHTYYTNTFQEGITEDVTSEK